MRELIARVHRRTVLLGLLGVVLLAGVAVGAGLTVATKSSPQVVIQAAAKGVQQQHGKRGRRGKRGPQGERGPAGSSDEHIVDFGIDWDGSGNAAGRDSSSVAVPGIGTLTLQCPASPADDPSVRRLVLSPAAGGRRTVASLTTFQGAGTTNASLQRYASEDTTPIVALIPRNGMISGNLSLEPNSGGSVDPGQLPVADVTLSSNWKDNDPIASQNFCHISVQMIAKGG